MQAIAKYSEKSDNDHAMTGSLLLRMFSSVRYAAMHVDSSATRNAVQSLVRAFLSARLLPILITLPAWRDSKEVFGVILMMIRDSISADPVVRACHLVCSITCV